MRRTGKLAGVGALAVVALIGWTRHPKPPAVPNCESPVTLSNPAVPPPSAGERGYPVVYGAMPFAEPAPAPSAYATPMPQQVPLTASAALAYQPVYYHRYRHYRHGRRV